LSAITLYRQCCQCRIHPAKFVIIPLQCHNSFVLQAIVILTGYNLRPDKQKTYRYYDGEQTGKPGFVG
jgi:hypothetical protein